MPRYADLPEAMTPFGQVLVDYMWNRRPPNRPPLSPNQLAIKLGVPKQNTNNWLFRASLPPFETIMATLAKLDIPLRDLYDAYKRAGILMPRWDEADTDAPPAEAVRQPIPRTRKATAVHTGDEPTDDAPAPRPYTPQPRQSPEQAEADEWQRMAEQTAAALQAEGVHADTIAAVVSHLRAQQSLPPGEHPLQRNLDAEHTEDKEQPEHLNPSGEASDTSSTDAPRPASSAGQKRREQPHSSALR